MERMMKSGLWCGKMKRWAGMAVIAVALVTGGAVQAQVAVLPAADTTMKASDQYKYYFSQGLRSKMLGNQDEAIGYFQRCLDFSQNSASAYYELGVLYSAKKDYSAATGYARNAWKKDPTNKWYGLLLIENLAAQGKHIECVPVYRALQKIEPDSESFRIGEIEMLILAKQEKEALKRLNKLPDEEEIAKWATVRKKDIYLSLNQFDKGANMLLAWLKKHPDDYEIRGILAEAYVSNKMKDKAAAQYEILRSQNPDNPAVNFSLGQFYFQNGDKKASLTEFLKGFKSPDVNPAIKIEIIKSFISSQNQQDTLDGNVVKLIEEMYLVDKGETKVDALYANYLYSVERLDEAEPIYRELIVKDPGNFINWQNLLFILNQKREYKDIITVSDSALTYFPGQGLFYLFKGMAEIEDKNYPVAISVLNKGLSQPEQNAEVIKQFYLSLAEALYRSGNSAEAFKNYDQMLVLEPDNVLVLNNYSYYLSLDGQNLDKALEMISKCVKLEKDNPTYLDTYAWVLFQMKEYSKALEPMTKAIELTPDPSGEVLEHYGDILFRNGRVEEARKAWISAKGKKEVSDKIDQKIKNGLN